MGKCMSASLENDLEDIKTSNIDNRDTGDTEKPTVVSNTEHKQLSSNGQMITHNKINSSSDHEDEDTAPHIAEQKQEKKVEDIQYISPTQHELEQQQELEIAHISHRGHYLNECKWSAQNILQRNESHYVSLKGYHFNPYESNDNDWIILKISGDHLIKITSLSINCARNTLIEQYPSKISIQFLSENSLNEILTSNRWTAPYIVSPDPLCTKKPNNTKDKHCETLIISMSKQYIDILSNNKNDQYVRISFIESHNEGNTYDGDRGKYAVHHLRLFGVHLLDEEKNDICLQNTVSQQSQNKNYKVDIKNDARCKLSPKPGPNNARVMMREHIFFINTESKTILMLKQAICDEYNRFVKGSNTYQPKQLLLIEGEFGLINDMMDCTILNKTLSEIGVTSKNNEGYYITVAFC